MSVKLFDPGDYWNSGFCIPDHIELNWNYCDNTVFYPAAIESFLSNIKIKNATETIVLWAAPNRLTLYAECIQAIENFAADISNSVILFDGNYSNWADPAHFVYAHFAYFEHVARCTWPRPTLPDTRSKTFMMMGTKDYPTRKYLLSRIVTAGADINAVISYKQVNRNGIDLLHYTPDQIKDIEQIAEQVDHRLPWPPLDHSVEFAQMPRQFLLETHINLVTDTFFEGDLFVSEKVYTAIAHGQLFVLLAPAGTLAYLRSQGYCTFDNWIDESYDLITDNYARLQAVTELILNLAAGDLGALYKNCNQAVLHNQQLFYSRDLNSVFVSKISSRPKRSHLLYC
jgi:hypothetical protein